MIPHHDLPAQPENPAARPLGPAPCPGHLCCPFCGGSWPLDPHRSALVDLALVTIETLRRTSANASILLAALEEAVQA